MHDLATFTKQLLSRDLPLTWPGHWISGQWVIPQKSSLTQSKSSVNPSTGETLIEFSLDKQCLNQAIDLASDSRGGIAQIPLTERLEILRRLRQGLADYQRPAMFAMQLEGGKPAWEAAADIEAAIRYLDWVVSHGDEVFENLVAPAKLGRASGNFALLPIGVTLAYLPFSSPVTSFAFYFTAAVLAGCPIVMVSSTHAVLSGILYGMLDQSLGFPRGLLSILFGNFSAFKPALADRRIAAVLYTGSREHCDIIRTESRAFIGRQLVLQSGGKNAVIVHASADMEQAIKCVVHGAFKSTGQLCSTTSRVFVYQSLLAEFQERLLAVVPKLPIGPTDRHSEPGAGAPFMGPLYADKAVQKFLRFQTMANREARKTLQWGKALESNSKGHFVCPGIHLMERFDNLTAYQGNVIFGPDLAIYEYDVLEDAIGKINTTDAAFAVSFIGDPAEIEARRAMFLAPNLLINLPTVEIEATLPLAGRLQSGHHRFHGPGVALYLCYPQVIQDDKEAQKVLSSWPWPKID